ncbi:uncharacterized protein EKO05_0010839 [Ascochyta rabiei]|uniref:Uncharacterized protein n=1 Tax=Didymella rabiei TaxID=5454 RepID=A0A163F6F7_DIDRA|nr:uncharacterized protein EKO05_0010839 [Ascochyta rabiei]KZM24173.1 hypothetical protein ST47_g4725 [Ascochyta rabiei]UPX20611.1 hypothetical protein EKO05_0010839 [Ascochyta rabiei]
MSLKSGARNRSQPTSSPSYNDDTEAASQQLLTETSPLIRQRAAIRASQLNLARIDALPKPPAMAPSTPVDNAGKLAKPGKLKRISFPDEPQRKPRGAKVYDIEPSPQKRTTLPVQVAAPEEEGQDEVDPADQVEDMVPETSQADPEAEQTDGSVESADLPAQDSSVALKRIAETLPTSPVASSRKDSSLTARLLKRRSADNPTSARPSDTGPAEVQNADEHFSTNSITENINVPVNKKQRLLRGPKFLDPDADALVDSLGVSIVTTQYETRPRGNPQPKVQIPIRSTKRRSSQAEAKDTTEVFANPAVAAAASRPQEEPSRPSRVAGTRAKSKASKEKALPDNNTVEPEEADKDDGEHPQTTAGQPKGNSEADGELAEADPENSVPEDDIRHSNQDIKLDAEDSAALSATNVQSHQSSALEEVFQYTESEKRPDTYLTKLGKKIHRTCEVSLVALGQSGEGSSLDHAAKCLDDITDLLRSIDTTVREERRVSFKVDAFAHLFRDLALVFKATYVKLQEIEGDITKSLGAMQILCSYVYEMLRLKDGIDSWKVSVPQRERGDRLIKNVASHLITPLRAVDQEFRFWLLQLEGAERRRQAHLHLQQKHEELELELVRKEEELSARKERRKRWQNLHIVRMQCEPDPARRRKLRFFEPVEVVETDANGVEFERVPFFGERSMPPPHWVAAPSSRDWTEEQEKVLLDALQSTAVLEDIFKTHCRPGGALRAFSVSDFTVKLDWIRSGWSRLSQQHGWEIPEWVKNIPVLP